MGDVEGSADVEAGSLHAPRSLRQTLFVVEELVGIHPLVTVKPVSGAVKLLTSAFGDGHDAGRGFAPEFRLVIGGHDAHSLNGIQADEVVAVAAIGVLHRPAVDRDAVAVGASAIDIKRRAA